MKTSIVYRCIVSTLGVAAGVFGTVAQTADIEERPQNLSPSGGVSVGGFPRLLISAAGVVQ
jgi:hypothetical protein